ncbi:LPXTG cell wall anchor domain-containing protein [Streptococcus sp. ZY1909104]|uniref:LPXTG cell wall anchor domain-containing protein n=1 Tax=Streptococcus sp. ZY1909104 TaxID=3233335 RepID=UPI00349F900E
MGGYLSGNELTVMASAVVVEEELVTDKLEPAYHEVPAFDLTADDDQDGFSNEAELLAGIDYADPASYPVVEEELVTDKLEPAYHEVPAFDLTADDDQDGFSNEAELLAGTNYADPASYPVVEEELVTDKLEPAYHEVPAFDLTADDDQDGFSNEAELLAGTDYADPASYLVVEEELVTDKLEPAYHEVPAFDLTADDDQDGFSNEAELLAGTDYADPASYPVVEEELVTEKGEPAYHYLPAFEFKVPAAPVTTSTVASPEPVSTSELSVPTGSVSPASATQSESASLPNTGDSQSGLALIGLTGLGLLGFAARKRKHS